LLIRFRPYPLIPHNKPRYMCNHWFIPYNGEPPPQSFSFSASNNGGCRDLTRWSKETVMHVFRLPGCLRTCMRVALRTRTTQKRHCCCRRDGVKEDAFTSAVFQRNVIKIWSENKEPSLRRVHPSIDASRYQVTVGWQTARSDGCHLFLFLTIPMHVYLFFISCDCLNKRYFWRHQKQTQNYKAGATLRIVRSDWLTFVSWPENHTIGIAGKSKL